MASIILTPLAFGISKLHYPPCPRNSIIVNPHASDFQKAGCGMVWIFSGIIRETKTEVLLFFRQWGTLTGLISESSTKQDYAFTFKNVIHT